MSTISWLQMQCCGANNYTDYEGATQWNNEYDFNGDKVIAVVSLNLHQSKSYAILHDQICIEPGIGVV